MPSSASPLTTASAVGMIHKGIVGGLLAVSAKVDDFVAIFLEVSDDPLLVIVAGVIGTNGDFHTGWGRLENGAWG